MTINIYTTNWSNGEKFNLKLESYLLYIHGVGVIARSGSVNSHQQLIMTTARRSFRLPNRIRREWLIINQLRIWRPSFIFLLNINNEIREQIK